MVHEPCEGGGGGPEESESVRNFYDERFKSEMWCLFVKQICQWQVVTRGIAVAHQPPGAISSSESGSRL